MVDFITLITPEEWEAVTEAPAVATPATVPPPQPGGMDPALLDLLTETVSHETYLAQDMYGKPSYSTPVLRPARLEYRVTTLTNAQGQERTSTTVLYLNGDVPVTVKDRILLPDGTAPTIQGIYSPTDPLKGNWVHHHEISL